MKAKLTERLEHWEFSSFQDYAGLREDTFCQKNLAGIHCDYDPDTFVEKSNELIDKKFVELFT